MVLQQRVITEHWRCSLILCGSTFANTSKRRGQCKCILNVQKFKLIIVVPYELQVLQLIFKKKTSSFNFVHFANWNSSIIGYTKHTLLCHTNFNKGCSCSSDICSTSNSIPKKTKIRKLHIESTSRSRKNFRKHSESSFLLAFTSKLGEKRKKSLGSQDICQLFQSFKKSV